jgi:ABC-type oligopeptide transport system substrate-binding subunit
MADPNTECYNRDLLLEKIEGFNEYFSGKAKNISGIKILDDYRIQFELTKPYYTFLKILASALCYIVPEEAVKYYSADFKKNPVGTGAFKIAEWDVLKGITLVKNENYWGKDENGNKLPYLNEIQVKTIANNFLLSTEFLKGECHLLFCDKIQHNKFISDSLINNKYNFYSLGSGTAVRFLGFSLNKNSPVNKKEFRQALDYIFASSEFSNDSIDNYISAFTLVPPHLFSYSNPKTDYPDSLDKVIKNFPAYYKKHPITILVSCELADIEYFKYNLKKFGFNPKVKIQTLQYYEEIIRQRPDVFRVSMHPSFPDPEGYYFLFYSKSDESLNLTGYSNPEFDRVFELALVEQDITKRNRLFANLEKILKEDYPAIYISHEGTRYYALPKCINGFKLRLEIPDYKFIWKNDEKHSAKP